jgi:acetyl-CoA acetyltransferase
MKAGWLRNRAALVGFGHTAYGRRGELGGNGPAPLVVEAVRKACDDAGISPTDIDGFSSYSNDEAVHPGFLAGMFGVREVRFSSICWNGGGGGLAAAFLHAALAVATGQASCVAVTRGVIQGGPRGRRYGHLRGAAAPRYPLIVGPAQMFALQARRHMHLYGTTIDHFGEVAINARLNAANNPDARFRAPITMADHHGSRLIADPLRLLDCCMESDSGSCVLVTAADRAADLRQAPVYLAGAAMGSPPRWGNGMLSDYSMTDEDFASAGQRTIAAALYRDAGISPADVDVLCVYDHFTSAVLMGLEDFQFVPRGESGPFVADGNIRLGGSLPVNPHGGNLAEVYNHGMSHVYEAMRQLRGQSHNQVPGAARVVVVAGSSPTPSSAMVLERAA